MRADLDQGEPADRLLGLGERPVGHGDRVTHRGHLEAGRIQAAGGEQDTGGGQFLDERGHVGIELGVRFGAAGLLHHQVTHRVSPFRRACFLPRRRTS
jgi:hypothetical protein